jgi:hypothetical protein
MSTRSETWFGRFFSHIFGFDEDETPESRAKSRRPKPTETSVRVSAKHEEALNALRGTTETLKTRRKKFDSLHDLKVSVENARELMPDFRGSKDD